MTLPAIMKYKILSSLALVALGITAIAPGAFANPTVGPSAVTVPPSPPLIGHLPNAACPALLTRLLNPLRP
ncbi:hypothetical protein IQE94_17615 (plasmid) [Synechocystis sp. PCC 7339]|uniref:hypothetical protein n=1 Tax=Synechocystis sp. PCC 7339 TaxID=2782213 RepID=UPI001CBE0D7F|nr:hypothetical protein [Synechocystis sp. PCC 7339]UAJ74676.1 hypothetical protein IQE94_17615 [Synechocystis sp. PCC 7339]